MLDAKMKMYFYESADLVACGSSQKSMHGGALAYDDDDAMMAEGEELAPQQTSAPSPLGTLVSCPVQYASFLVCLLFTGCRSIETMSGTFSLQ